MKRTAAPGRTFTTAEVVNALAGQAEAQTLRAGKITANAIAMVLARFGETQITIGPDDIAALARTHRVEIISEQDPRTFTYKLVRIAKDDNETANLPLPPSG